MRSSRGLVELIRPRAMRTSGSGNTVLLIGGAPNERCWKLAFLRGAPNVSLRTVPTTAECQAYLSGVDAYADRDGYPMPRLILVDLDVSQGTGLEFLEWLKAKPGLMRIPVFVLTSAVESGDVDQAYALGARSCLLKGMDQKAARDLAKGIEAYAALLTPEIGQPAYA
jgi:CheY-like chemotaxis protein